MTFVGGRLNENSLQMAKFYDNTWLVHLLFLQRIKEWFQWRANKWTSRRHELWCETILLSRV